MTAEIRVIGISGMPEIEAGDALALLISEAAEGQGVPSNTGISSWSLRR